MKPIIRVENLSKQYRIGAQQVSYETLRDFLANALTVHRLIQVDTGKLAFLGATNDV